MSRKKSTEFVRPRGPDGTFLPKSEWTKADLRRFKRAQKEGQFKPNPYKKAKAGSKRKKNWYPPQDPETKRFLPEEEWTPSEKRAYKRALKEGLVAGIADTYKDPETGRFVSKDKSKRKKKPKKREEAIERRGRRERRDDDYDDDLSYEIRGLRKAMKRAARSFEEATEAMEEASHRQVRPARRRVYIPERQERVVYVDQRDRPRDELPPANHQQEVTFDDDCECDPCPPPSFPGLEGMRSQVGEISSTVDELQDRIGAFVPVRNRSGLRRRMNPNPSERALMYNRGGFAQKFRDLIDFFRDRPLLAVAGIGAVALVGYALYRVIRMVISLRGGGAHIFGHVITFPGEEPYRITSEDMLWLARSIWGEVSRTPSAWSERQVQQGATAVLWSYANHYMTVGRKRELYPTLAQFVQAYSQPINPRWDDPSDSRCQANPDMCTPSRISFRRSLRTKPWAEFPQQLTMLVEKFAQGRLPNNIGTRTDFRAAGTGYRPADPLNVAGNVFGTAPNARRRQVA